jgi:hypothetical protein
MFVLLFCSKLNGQLIMDNLIGVNLRREDPTDKLAPFGFAREYHNWMIAEGDKNNPNAATGPDYPANAIKWSPGYQFQSHTQFPVLYQNINQGLRPFGVQTNTPICATINITLPSISGYAGQQNTKLSEAFNEMKPVFPANSSPIQPASYEWIADYVTQFANHFCGPNIASPTIPDKCADTGSNPSNVGYVELWNETDKTSAWFQNIGVPPVDEPRIGFTAQEYAAMTNAAFDGFNNNVRGDLPGNLNSYTLGVSQFTNARFVMNGLSDFDPANVTYLRDMRIAFNNQRTVAPANRTFPFRVINFHHYCDNNWTGLTPTGVGVSPESDHFLIGGVDKTFKQRLIDVRTDLTTTIAAGETTPVCTNCEFWLSEFGWDTNTDSDQRAPAIGTNDQQEVQGQWLTRAYMEIAAAGWNRAMQFCVRDNSTKAIGGRFQASGVLKDRYSKNDFKKSFYYISTMKSVLTGTRFDKEFSTSPNSSFATDVRVMRFVKDIPVPSATVAGDFNMALWLPSSSAAVRATTFALPVAATLAENAIKPIPFGTTQVLLVTLDPRDLNGIRQTPISVVGGNITIPVNIISERPIFLIVGGGNALVDITAPTIALTAQPLSCNTVRLSWTNPAGTFASYRVYYHEKNDSREAGVNPPFNASDTDWKLYSLDYPGQIQTSVGGLFTNVNSIVVTGLEKMEDEYHFYVEGVTPTGVVSSAIIFDVKTLKCEGNTIPPAGLTFTPAAAAAAGANAFQVSDVDRCYPQNTPINYAAAAGIADVVTVNLGAPYNVEAISIFDVNDAGYLRIEYSTDGINFSPFRTEFEPYYYELWWNFPVPFAGNAITHIRVTKTGLARYGRIIVTGKPNATGSYSPPDCCPTTAIINQRYIFGTVNANPLIPSTSVSNLSSQLAAATSGKEIVVHGTLNIDLGATFTNTKFLMMAGAKIVVPTGKNIAFNNSQLRGCDVLWDAIDVTGAAYIDFNNSVARDGLNAIRLNDASTRPIFTITNSRFERCYIGMNTTSTSTAAPTSSSPADIKNTVFDGTDDDLKPYWSGSPNPVPPAPTFYLQTAYAGATINRSNPFNVGWSSTGIPNVFKNLRYGVTGTNSVVNIANTRFQNIFQLPTPAGNGECVSLSNANLTFHGLNTPGSTNIPNTFEKANVGVYLSTSSFFIKDCKTYDIWNGIVALDCKPRTPVNKIQNVVIGVAANTGINVTSNNIGVEINGNDITTAGSGDCIVVQGYTGTPANVFNIHHNKALVNNTTSNNAAIRVNSTTGAKVENNTDITLNFYKTNNSAYGINIQSANNASILSNSVNSLSWQAPPTGWDWQTNAYQQYGLWVNNSNTWLIQCNTFDNTKYGLVFNGSNTASQNGLYANEIRHHIVGYELRNSANTATQTDRWTRWTQPNASYIGGAARHWSTSSLDWLASQVKVPIGASQFSPQSNVIPVAAVGSWFLQNSASAPGDCLSLFGGQTEDRNDEYALKVNDLLTEGGLYYLWVNGKINQDAMSGVGRFEMDKAVYQMLVSEYGTAFTQHPAYSKFITTHENDPIGQLTVVDKAIQNVLGWQESTRLEREDLSFKLNDVQEQIAKNNLNLESIDPSERFKFIQQHPNLFNFPDYWGDILKMDEQQLTLWKSESKNLAAINSSIVAENDFVAFEKEANSIYLQTVAINNYKFSSEQESTLLTMAEKCVSEYGNGVVKARVLYSYIDPSSTARWNDECVVKSEGKEAFYKVPSTNDDIILNVVPNPVTDEIWFETNAPVGTYFALSNMMGKTIVSGETNSDNWTKIDAQDLLPGCYTMTIIGKKPKSRLIVKQ